MSKLATKWGLSFSQKIKTKKKVKFYPKKSVKSKEGRGQKSG
jgi:hypothetical protein